MHSSSRTRVLALAVLLLVILGSGFQLLPRNHSRELAERFASALAASDPGLDSYFSPNAEVFLEGSTVPVSPRQFQEYVQRLKVGHQAFQAASRVYLTDGGAGWFLQIAHVDQADYLNNSQTPPQLWMESTIDDQHIARLWIHFTREALARQMVTPDAYRAAAAARGTPVPEAWAEGTAAMLADAERNDARANGVWGNPGRQALSLAGMTLVVGAAIVAGLRRRRSPRAPAPSSTRGEMLAKLRHRYARVDPPIREIRQGLG
jgi:hypothetical protein